MVHKDSYDPQSDQFTLSLELLRLMQWIIEHDAEGVKRLINRALAQGLNEKINNGPELNDAQESNEVQHSIIDFFVLLEALLFEAMNDHAVKNVLQRNLIPAVSRIDTSACDTATVRFSLERATTQIQNNPQENPRDLLMKELLKRWKPPKKNVAN